MNGWNSLDAICRSTPQPLIDTPAIIDVQGTTSWSALSSRIDRASADWSSLRGTRVSVDIPAMADGIVALAACDRLGCLAFLADANRLRSIAERDATCHDFQLGASLRWQEKENNWHLDRCGETTATDSPGVVILTSGTEGIPKAARHTWSTLLRTVRPSPTGPSERWLLAFRMHLYAGLQVLGQCLANHGCLVLPDPNGTPDETVRMIVKAGTTHASATPSYWRRMLLLADRDHLARAPLRQITLGGEAVDQPLLDQLKALFPHSRITHIYATTELGRCFAVSDGEAGFPTAFLEPRSLSGVELAIREGELWARSSNAMVAQEEGKPVASRKSAENDLGWIATGDLVTIRDARVLFTGRIGERINVGGNKVDPWSVEQVIREAPGVRDVLVFAKSSSIAGALVACQVVRAPHVSEESVRTQILETCQAQLQRHEIPRLIEFVPTIGLSAAGKRQRNPSPPISQ